MKIHNTPFYEMANTMLISSLEEFVTFAKYLNYTHAASELHMTQSGLSKHMKQLENELGFELVVRDGNILALTVAGSRFLALVQPILAELEDTVDACRKLNLEEPFDFVAQMPLYPDAGAREYYTLIQQVRALNGNARIRFKDTARTSLHEALRKDMLNLALAYHCDPIEERARMYAEEGFLCKYLVSEPLAVWVDRESPLAKEQITVKNLNKQTVFIPNEKCFLMGDAIQQLCKQKGVRPHFEVVDSGSHAEFLALHRPGGVYVYPQALFESSAVVQATASRIIVPFVQGEADVHVFAVAYPSQSNGSALACQLIKGTDADDERED